MKAFSEELIEWSKLFAAQESGKQIQSDLYSPTFYYDVKLESWNIGEYDPACYRIKPDETPS